MSKTNTSPTDLFSGPLCCRYLLAIFENTPARVGEGERIRDQVLQWGIGVLSDGQQELLGVWHRTATDESARERVSEDLQLRGVEQIRFVAGLEPAHFKLAVRASFPGATAMPSSGQVLRQIESDLRAQDRAAASHFLASLYAAGTAERARAALTEFAAGPTGATFPASVDHYRLALEQLAPFYALAPRLRRIVRTVDRAAQHLSRIVTRAVNRHGCFPSLEAATSFVAETLMRAEGDLSAFDTSSDVSPGYRAARVSARSGTAALRL